LSVRGDAITDNIVVLSDCEMDPAVVEMSTHERDAASEIALPWCGISVLKCLIRLGRCIGGVAAASNVEPEGLHLIKASRYRWDVFPGHGQDGVAGIINHVHQLEEEPDTVVWANVIACLVCPGGRNLISIFWLRTMANQ
jgi:hypothetical protein